VGVRFHNFNLQGQAKSGEVALSRRDRVIGGLL